LHPTSSYSVTPERDSRLGDPVADICLGFEVHQPRRINGSFRRELSKGKTARDLFPLYFDLRLDRSILKRVCRKCYIPANQILLEKVEEIEARGQEFKVNLSLSGVLVEQLERWSREALDSFRKLGETGCVEFLDQTYYHSLSSLFSEDRGEFIEQVHLHRELMKDVFGFEPRVFENTEFIFNNSLAREVAALGYAGIFTESAGRILGWRSSNYVYRALGADLPVLMRNYRLSDDIAFRFSAVDWPEWPLTADKYASWLASTPGDCITIFLDYETFGEHQWPETGILEFLRYLPEEILAHGNLRFGTASEMIERHRPVGTLDVPDFETVSWADAERSTNAWLGNDMQRTCFQALKRMEPFVKAARGRAFLKLWRYLQISDHLYYLYTQPDASGMVHGYFSSQPPVKAFWTYNRIISDLYEKLSEGLPKELGHLAMLARVVPPDKAFHFHEGARYIELSAHSLEEFREGIRLAPDASISYHLGEGDFSSWLGYLGDAELASAVSGLDPDDPDGSRRRILELIDARLGDLLPSRGKRSA
jgi:alpha-amylase